MVFYFPPDKGGLRGVNSCNRQKPLPSPPLIRGGCTLRASLREDFCIKLIPDAALRFSLSRFAGRSCVPIRPSNRLPPSPAYPSRRIRTPLPYRVRGTRALSPI